MNHFRYLAYRRVQELLDSGESVGLVPEERELFRDMAEQMLLTRPSQEDDAEEVAHSATAALRTLTARGTLTRATAIDLWEEIYTAGPERFQRPTPAFPGPVSAALH